MPLLTAPFVLDSLILLTPPSLIPCSLLSWPVTGIAVLTLFRTDIQYQHILITGLS
jgi:hypothetical protein